MRLHETDKQLHDIPCCAAMRRTLGQGGWRSKGDQKGNSPSDKGTYRPGGDSFSTTADLPPPSGVWVAVGVFLGSIVQIESGSPARCVRGRWIDAFQARSELGAGGSGTPPGPAEKSSGESAGSCPMPGALQSQTPS